MDTTCTKYKMEIEPRHEKTCLRGFRPGLTQTGLYSDSRWFVLYLCSENKDADLCLYFQICKSRFSHDAVHISRAYCKAKTILQGTVIKAQKEVDMERGGQTI